MHSIWRNSCTISESLPTQKSRVTQRGMRGRQCGWLGRLQGCQANCPPVRVIFQLQEWLLAALSQAGVSQANVWHIAPPSVALRDLQEGSWQAGGWAGAVQHGSFHSSHLRTLGPSDTNKLQQLQCIVLPSPFP